MAASAEPCGQCGVPSALRCASCGAQTYCGKPHQRQHWPEHRLVCRAPRPANSAAEPESRLVRVRKSQALGRHLSAAEDVPEGTVLFADTALIVGPPSGAPPMCLGCLRGQASARCGQCSAPLCHKRCQHLSPECAALRTAVPSLDASAHPGCILPLRCLLNVRKQVPRWSEFLQLEAHLEVRRQLPVWRERCLGVVQVLKRHGLISADGGEDEMVQRICGILDVNSFEVRGPDGGVVRAIFPQAALMAHSCIANVHVAVNDKHVMTVRAAKSISKGDTLYYCYTSVLQGTAARQEHLWEGKYFRCECVRCTDPSELGTHLSSIWCPRCAGGLVMPARGVRSGETVVTPFSQVVSQAKSERQNSLRELPPGIERILSTNMRKRDERPSSTAKPNSPESAAAKQQSVYGWQCTDCQEQLSSSMIRTVERLSMDLVDSVVMKHRPGGDEDCDRFVDDLEDVLLVLQGTLTPQHAVVLHAKQLLGGAYRDRIRARSIADRRSPDPKDLVRSVELCRELSAILEKLEDGAISRNTGIALHALHEPLLLSLHNRKAEGTELVEGLSEIRQLLLAALRHLRIEPAESPEGRLAAGAFAQLADIEDRLRMSAQNEEAKRAKPHRKNKGKNRRR